MTRSAERVAEALLGMYREQFDGKSGCKFCIRWSDFRELAGGGPAGAVFINEVRDSLGETGYVLVPLEDSILIADEWELEYRLVPGRIIDKYLEIVVEEKPGDDLEMEEDDDE